MYETFIWALYKYCQYLNTYKYLNILLKASVYYIMHAYIYPIFIAKPRINYITSIR